MRQPQPRRVAIVRYVLPDGTRVKKGTKGAKRITSKSDTYYVSIGRKRVSLGTSDLTLAWANLRKLLRKERDRELGIADDTQEHAARGLGEHLDAWLETVADKGTSAAEVKALRSKTAKLAGLAGWKRLGDLDAASCLRALARLQHQQGRSAQTRNHYLRAIRQFATWAADEGRLARDPLRTCRPVSVEEDRRHDRRIPTDAEVGLLMEHLEVAPVRCGMTGRQRGLGYRVAMATGLRASELRSLTRESFDLEKATVTVQAAYSKRGRTDVQPLPAWLVAELREWFDAGGECWQGLPLSFPGRPLKEDLERAGIPRVTKGPNGPLFLDMHSFRHWFVSQLAGQAGISPKVLMTLARHSTPALTLKTYAKADTGAAQAAVDRLPEVGG